MFGSHVVMVSCHVGHPILNDPLYSHPAWKRYGNRTNKGAGQGADQKTSPLPNFEEIAAEISQSRFADPAPRTLTGCVEERSRAGGEEEGEGKEEREEGGVSGADKRRGEDEDTMGEVTSGGEREESLSHESKTGESTVASDGGQAEPETRQSEEHQESKPQDTATSLAPPTTTPSPSPSADAWYDPDCTECKRTRPTPTPDDMFMYLHALSYKVRRMHRLI